MKNTYLHRLKAVAASLALLAVLAAPALAHRVNVFAYVEGNDVVVECSYSRSERVRFGDVEVFDATTGAALLAGKTDEKGEFRFSVPPAVRAAKADLRIVLKAGEGHQNSTEVKAAEYLSAAPEAATTTPAAAVPVNPPTAPVAAAGPVAAATAAPIQTGGQPMGQGGSAPALDAAALERIVEAAVEKKIAPLRAILVGEKEKGPGLTEIIGGLGWLVGLAGIAAYFAAKSKKPRS